MHTYDHPNTMTGTQPARSPPPPPHRAIFLPAAFTSFGGWVSIITYAVATALPLLFIAAWGAKILEHTPNVSDLVMEEK